MDRKSRTGRRLLARILCGLTASVLGTQAAAGEVALLSAQQPARQVLPHQSGERAREAPARIPTLTLGECIHIALEKQPALGGHRASVASAQAQLRSLEDLRLISLVSPQVPIRRKQAALGVDIARAGLCQAEWETVYAVTRNYISVVYAHDQLQVTRGLVESLRAARVGVQAALDAEAPGARREQLDQVDAYLQLAESRRKEADWGADRALALLREAMGVAPCFKFQAALAGLTVPKYSLTCKQAIDLALARRGELVQAADVAQVACLEIDAQGASHLFTVRTFASAVDIHARPIPQGFHNGTYRPDALGVEMPTVLVGHRQDRMDRARDLHGRAEAVVAKTRNLIALEAEHAFLKWQEAADKLQSTEQATGHAVRYAAATDRAWTSQGTPDIKNQTEKDLIRNLYTRVKLQDQLNALVMRAQAQAAHNEAVYHHLLALADLQRVTAGGLCLELDGPPAAPPPSPPLTNLPR
jgi:hypothetical protein